MCFVWHRIQGRIWEEKTGPSYWIRDWQGLSRELGLQISGKWVGGAWLQRGTKLAIKELRQMSSVYDEIDIWVLRIARLAPNSTH